MSKVNGFATFLFGGAVVTVLSACDVQVHDATPGQYPANHDVGMYEIKATAVPDTLVSPGSVFMFALSDKQRIELTPNRAGTEWRGMYSIRCHASFPLQLHTVWKLQGLTTKSSTTPAQPRTIQLIEPEPPKEAPPIETSAADSAPSTARSGKGKAAAASKAPKTGWTGSVKYRFMTQQDTQITGARIEPLSQDANDVNAAKAISVTSSMPVDAPCGTPTELQLTSTAQKAQANLVIDTNLPAYPHWTTKVTFAPKS